MGDLIDFSDEPEETTLNDTAALAQVRARPKPHSSSTDLFIGRKPAPPRPNKPVALRSTPSDPNLNSLGVNGGTTPPPVPRSRKPSADRAGPHPLSQMHNSSQQTVASSRSLPGTDKIPAAAAQNAASKTAKVPPPPPPPRRREAPSSSRSLSPRGNLNGRRLSSNSDVDFDALPPSAASQTQVTPPTFTRTRTGSLRSGSVSPTSSPSLGPAAAAAPPPPPPTNRKHELWMRRLQRAQEILESHGVALYTWRRGDDVVAEAVGIVREELKRIGLNGERDATTEGKRFERQIRREQSQQQQQQQRPQQQPRVGSYQQRW